ncbi:hypothetical protein ASU28_04810 [Lactiplantibacillus paraplantarum]|nr:hypothetical protein ASU28_04810 [Lactiplantibacillus paraplantarum]
MSPYTHLTLKDRECILLGVTLHHTYQLLPIKSVVPKPLCHEKLNATAGRVPISAVKAQQNYHSAIKESSPQVLQI